jgi:HSP20 family molecular chaperone IbpA
MSDREGIDEVFRDLATFTGESLADPKLDDSAFGGMDQLECDTEPPVDDELILSEDYVTYIAYSAECDMENFSVSTVGSDIEVTAGDFKVRRLLLVRVDEEYVTAEYRNGVLSVRLRRIVERDEGA